MTTTADAPGRVGLTTPQVRSQGIAVRRSLVLMAFSALVPGSAQLAAGNRTLGRVALRIWIGVIAVLVIAVLLALPFRSFMIGLYLNPITLRVIQVAVLVFGVGWSLLLLDAWRLGNPKMMSLGGKLVSGVLALALFGFAAPLLAVALFAFLLHHYRPPFIRSPLEASVLYALLILAGLLLRLRLRHLALLPLLVALSLYAFRRTPLVAGPSNADQVAALTFIQNITPPAAPVFDGWQHIAAPFRPHAWFYFFLHREIRPMLTDADHAQLLADLQSNKIHPALVILDDDNRALPAPIVTFLESHYPTTPLPAAPSIRTP